MIKFRDFLGVDYQIDYQIDYQYFDRIRSQVDTNRTRNTTNILFEDRSIRKDPTI